MAWAYCTSCNEELERIEIPDIVAAGPNLTKCPVCDTDRADDSASERQEVMAIAILALQTA